MRTKNLIAAMAIAMLSTGAMAQSLTWAQVAGNAAAASSASHSSSTSSVGGTRRGEYSVENYSSASNISGAAVTRERDGDTFIGVTETWSNGTNYSATNNNGGTGYANSSQSGSAAASYYRPLPTWTWDN